MYTIFINLFCANQIPDHIYAKVKLATYTCIFCIVYWSCFVWVSQVNYAIKNIASNHDDWGIECEDAEGEDYDSNDCEHDTIGIIAIDELWLYECGRINKWFKS